MEIVNGREEAVKKELQKIPSSGGVI